ncbi:MAG: M1 family metallopeptidase [Acidobacteriota bacterium]
MTSILALALAAATLSAPVASYRIEVELRPEERALLGHQRITWTNPVAAAASTLQFHLYLNAFRDRRSTLLRELEWPPERWEGVREPWGWIEIEEIRVAGGEDLSSRARYLAPDDGNLHDRTVVEFPLAEPVPPGGRIEIDLKFRARLPRLLTRTGARGDFFFVAQWFPKLGVYQASPAGGGAWNCHQFHYTSEFFADFGEYDIDISVPESYVIAAAGDRLERHVQDGRRRERYLLRPAHDFAWSAWPGFLLTEREFVRAGGRPLRLRIFHPRGRSALARRHGAVLEAGVRTLEEWIGPYPYEVLTVVEAPPGAAEGVEWMEYPGLITLHAPRLLNFWPWRGIRILDVAPFELDWNLEEVDLHELGHQWWYGTVASNEFEDPWLDEGINTYVTGKVIDHLYGTRASAFEILGLRAGIVEHDRPSYVARPDTDPPTAPAWGFLDNDSYSAMVYTKTALVLRTLEGILGEETILRALKRYFRDSHRRHPRPEAFLEALEREAGRPLGGLWRELMEGTGTLDYRVEWVKHLEGDDPRWLVGIARAGTLQVPVWIEFRYADGTLDRSRWEARRRWTRYTLRSSAPLLRVQIDPQREVPLDLNRLNNGWAEHSGPAPRRWAWVAAALASVWLDLWATLL